MIGPAQILRRWWARRNTAELPVVAIPPVMDDDDTTTFWGDVLYFRGLMDAIEYDCARTRGGIAPFDPASAAALEAALELVRDDAYFEMAVPA